MEAHLGQSNPEDVNFQLRDRSRLVLCVGLRDTTSLLG